jgi:hypothetical protein
MLAKSPAPEAHTDPIIALLSRWSAANELFNSKPDDNSDEWAAETYGRLEAEMSDPPKVGTAAGAVAALEYAIVENTMCIDGHHANFVKRAHRFMARFLAGPDPIFSAIAEHKRLWNEVNTAQGDAAVSAAGDTETAYLDGMLRIAPATLPGLLAWLDYIFTEPGIGNCAHDDDLQVVRETLRQFGARRLGQPVGGL